MKNQVLKKLNDIEKEISNMQLLLAMHLTEKKKKRLASLKGMLNGIEINEEDIEDSKKSLFKVQ